MLEDSLYLVSKQIFWDEPTFRRVLIAKKFIVKKFNELISDNTIPNQYETKIPSKNESYKKT